MNTVAHRAGLALLILLWLWPLAGRAEEPVDILGTWYVLIHYQDPETANPDVMRWKDLVWVFSRQGDRLQWTEFPIVVFEEQAGRFENRQRILGAWEPNAQQLETIRKGPRVNERGKVGITNAVLAVREALANLLGLFLAHFEPEALEALDEFLL